MGLDEMSCTRFRKTGRNLNKFHIFCNLQMFCLDYVQHHKDQLEVVIWVKDHFKKGLCQKINILAFSPKSAFEFPEAFPKLVGMIYGFSD